jgi:RHS repeat-associated protein
LIETDLFQYDVEWMTLYSSVSTDYFLTDAPGSVRQLADADGQVSLAQSYEPYGETHSSSGEGATSYGFAGEWTDSYIELLYLRSRMYSPGTGRFLTRDTWQGNYNRPLSLHRWNYVEGNPVNYTDPSGHIKSGQEATEADQILEDLKKDYDVVIVKDWGDVVIPDEFGISQGACQWNEGAWKLEHLRWVKTAIQLTAGKMKGDNKFRLAFRYQVEIVRNSIPSRSWAPPGVLSSIFGDVVLVDDTFSEEKKAKHYVIHELGHVWDDRRGWKLSRGMMEKLGTQVCVDVVASEYGYTTQECHYDVTAGKEPPVGDINNPYPNDDDQLTLPRSIQGPWEDWADSFAVYVYKDYFSSKGYQLLGPIRWQYIYDQIQSIP